MAPGIPDLASQERRDHVATGTYRKLHESGSLMIAEGLRVQPPAALWDAIVEAWGYPAMIVCDRFRLAELQDVVDPSVPIEPRVTRWSEASSDIRALRQHCKDGPFAIAEESRSLIAASLAVSEVKNDDQGNTRLSKKGSNNTARDDVAASLTLAAGAYQREASSGPVGINFY